MNRIYSIYIDNKLIGTTWFENADPPMGVVSGKIGFNDIPNPYIFLKSHCQKNKIEFDDSPDIELIHTRTIPTLKVINDRGEEIKGQLGNQISGMSSDSFDLSIEGIPYPFYGEEFPKHVKDYDDSFR